MIILEGTFAEPQKTFEPPDTGDENVMMSKCLKCTADAQKDCLATYIWPPRKKICFAKETQCFDVPAP